MPLRMRRISSTSWIPSGFFLKRNWSRCRPSDEDVNACPQYWQLRSLTVGFTVFDAADCEFSSPMTESSGELAGGFSSFMAGRKEGGIMRRERERGGRAREEIEEWRAVTG
jgi:hypothetical protein